jgi:hypothetical protein
LSDPAAPDLAQIIEASASELEAAERRPTNGGAEWSIGGVAFAAVESHTAEFRLAPPVVAAALRTPDTSRSPRGADWVFFRPATLDQHAVDRATAWLASAWRRADGEG